MRKDKFLKGSATTALRKEDYLLHSSVSPVLANANISHPELLFIPDQVRLQQQNY